MDLKLVFDAITTVGYPIVSVIFMAIYVNIKDKTNRADTDKKVDAIIQSEREKAEAIIKVEKEKTELFKKQYEVERKDKDKLYRNLSEMTEALKGFNKVQNQVEERVSTVENAFEDLNGKVDVINNKMDAVLEKKMR